MNAPAAPELVLTSSLLRLAGWLQGEGYRFTTVTPATHARVNARQGHGVACDLRDVFGWSRPFEATLLPDAATDPLRAAGLLLPAPEGLLRSAVRFSSLGGQLFAHSAFPTLEENAVFFGPDTYRFVDLVQQELRRQPLPLHGRILDVGCGAGPGGIMAALASADAGPRLALTDINPRAPSFAAANAAHANCGQAELAQGDLFHALDGQFDLIVANPPYLNDDKQRLYRHGGGRWGEALSARIVREGMERLAPEGRLVLYTGAVMVDGRDPLLESLRPHLESGGHPWSYREMDPDVFGEELDEPAYADAERIAAVALVVQRHDHPMRVHLHPAMA
ncbi:MAG TPA: class I SAM-dependent methyltransferase, partial [Ramlibacter sp.]|nr:class I SAM-dependent methyltransferase [Ramlibacter sp.]